MELALYCPVYGYYEKEKDKVGRRGDFFTSVNVGGLFGELLALQFATWIEALPDATSRLQIVEAGAHDGCLARDILHSLRDRRPALFQNLQYCIVESSTRRQEWQAHTLAAFGDRVHWTADVSAAAPAGVCGVIFSNELLDALPVHRIAWDAKARAWFEWGVGVRGTQLVWRKMPAPQMAIAPSDIPHLPEELLEVLPDGYILEIGVAAKRWWSEAARALHRGKLVTLDYGMTDEEFISPERRRGTLRAYRNHRVSDDLLADPGNQDLTAHVNFTAVQLAGQFEGLRTEALMSQEKFLTAIAERAWTDRSIPGEWTPARAREFQTLTHPEHLGRAFRVLIQSRVPARSPQD